MSKTSAFVVVIIALVLVIVGIVLYFVARKRDYVANGLDGITGPVGPTGPNGAITGPTGPSASGDAFLTIEEIPDTNLNTLSSYYYYNLESSSVFIEQDTNFAVGDFFYIDNTSNETTEAINISSTYYTNQGSGLNLVLASGQNCFFALTEGTNVNYQITPSTG